ncbi:MAG: hypothetical protein H6739_40825 [Alphaproteobacteria bacterium]|nr:hypothetical protein [Alphaproteobacteria bacterium]
MPETRPMTLPHAIQLIHADRARSPTLAALSDALTSGMAKPLGDTPGQETASDLRATFALRQRTTTAAGIQVVGLPHVLEQLAACPDDAQILLFHFGAPATLYAAFIRADDEQVLGAFALPLPDRATSTTWTTSKSSPSSNGTAPRRTCQSEGARSARCPFSSSSP